MISGLARGIDAEAHRGALEAGGPTVAVLGCGIDRDYPRAHAALAGRIAEVGPARLGVRARRRAGALALSGSQPDHRRPGRSDRHRRGARARSGALITADFALEDGREVFAVPGEITSALSRGTNELLRLGAAPLLESGDVLAALGLEPAPARPGATHSPEAQRILAFLIDRSASVDELVERSGLAADVVAAAVVELELSGEATCAEGVYRALCARQP